MKFKKYGYLLLSTSILVSTTNSPLILSSSNTINAEESLPKIITSNQADFVKTLAPYAQKIAAEKDLYASIMIAQATLESAHGSSKLSVEANNLFGIKAKEGYIGSTYLISSKEYVDKEVLLTEDEIKHIDELRKTLKIIEKKENNIINYYKVITAEQMVDSYFKKYDSLDQSLIGYSEHFTQSPWYTNYYKGIHKSESSSYKEALNVLNGKYATDPNYITKLQTLIDRYNLTQYDTTPNKVVEVPPISTTPINQNPNVESKPIENSPVSNTPVESIPVEVKPTENKVVPNAPKGFHLVVKGDTVYNLSKKYNIAQSDFVSWNNIVNNNLSLGSLVVIDKYYAPKKSETTQKPTENKTTTTTQTITSTHTVIKGDTLSSIAKKYNITVKEIKTLNKLESDSIKVGQKLIVKSSTSNSTVYNNSTNNNPTSTPTPTPTPTSTSTSTSTNNYKVKVNGSLNVRSSMSTSSNNIIGKLYNNDSVTVSSISGKWAKITFNKKTSYISSDYIVKVSTTSANNTVSSKATSTTTSVSSKSNSTYKVSASSLTVRSSKTINSKNILGYLKKNDSVVVKSISGKWANITFKGKDAFVSTDYLKK